MGGENNLLLLIISIFIGITKLVNVKIESLGVVQLTEPRLDKFLGTPELSRDDGILVGDTAGTGGIIIMEVVVNGIGIFRLQDNLGLDVEPVRAAVGLSNLSPRTPSAGCPTVRHRKSSP